MSEVLGSPKIKPSNFLGVRKPFDDVLNNCKDGRENLRIDKLLFWATFEGLLRRVICFPELPHLIEVFCHQEFMILSRGPEMGC